MKKTIGVPMINQGENSVGLTKSYLEYLKNFGQVILLAPDAFIPGLDLLVLPGGKDVANGNPYDFSFNSTDNERFLEWFDTNTLPLYIENSTPIYGICRGFQTLLRHFKIPLIQDIWWDHGYSEKDTDKVNTLTFEKYVEEVGDAEAGGRRVGSWHHQGVSLETMRSQEIFNVIAYCSYKIKQREIDRLSIVEFIEHKELPIIAEQSHPERNRNKFEHFLINKLLKNN